MRRQRVERDQPQQRAAVGAVAADQHFAAGAQRNALAPRREPVFGLAADRDPGPAAQHLELLRSEQLQSPVLVRRQPKQQAVGADAQRHAAAAGSGWDREVHRMLRRRPVVLWTWSPVACTAPRRSGMPGTRAQRPPRSGCTGRFRGHLSLAAFARPVQNDVSAEATDMDTTLDDARIAGGEPLPDAPAGPIRHGGVLYLQIAETLARSIRAGAMRRGERVPSVRELARQHGVSLSTATQAYRSLEDARLIEARPRSGYFVAARPPSLPEPDTSRPPQVSKRVDRLALAAEVMRIAEDPGYLSFGAACPAASLFDETKIRRA